MSKFTSRVCPRLLAALLAGATLGSVGFLPGGMANAWAQGHPAAQDGEGSAQEAAPKQVTLTQTTINNLVKAQEQIRAVEAKTSGGDDAKAPDPKMEAKIEGIAKSNGFATMGDFADASYSVGMVLAGMDPSSGNYIGTQAALKKQIAEVEGDKKMPPNEKKEALGELNAALKDAPSETPLPGNVALVKSNLSKLNEGAPGGAD